VVEHVVAKPDIEQIAQHKQDIGAQRLQMVLPSFVGGRMVRVQMHIGQKRHMLASAQIQVGEGLGQGNRQGVRVSHGGSLSA
jgi:hypothetical protein